MRFRRNLREAPSNDVMDESPPSDRDERVTLHLERTVISLTARMQDVCERLESVEQQLELLTERVTDGPTNSDVMEVRIHSAKLAAELTRATVELRGQIGMVRQDLDNTSIERPAQMHSSHEGVVTITTADRADVDTSRHPASV